MFPVQSVCLPAVLQKDYWPDLHETWWRGEAQAKKEPIKFWRGSKLQGGHTNYFLLLLTVQDRVFGLGRGLCSLSAPLVLN